MAETCDRRAWMTSSAVLAAAAWLGRSTPSAGSARSDEIDDDGDRLARTTRDFIVRCRREDGGYAPSPDPGYNGRSDTAASDLAAVTYAAVLAKSMGWELPRPRESIAFVRGRQRLDDGRFVSLAGAQDPASDLAVLYNTTQGVVALRALGTSPDEDPSPVIERLVESKAAERLPWYTTSFFPLFFAALGKPLPDAIRRQTTARMERSQAADGYLDDHVASTFHMAHFYRMLGQPTPKADLMVARTLRDQKPTGGWDVKDPDWDVHACFDALFILRQLGGGDPKVRAAIDRGADWALGCRNADGGFGHYPGWHSDMDAVYFQFGSLLQAGRVPGMLDLPDAHTLSWGHAMRPERVYASVPPATAS